MQSLGNFLVVDLFPGNKKSNVYLKKKNHYFIKKEKKNCDCWNIILSQVFAM